MRNFIGHSFLTKLLERMGHHKHLLPRVMQMFLSLSKLACLADPDSNQKTAQERLTGVYFLLRLHATRVPGLPSL